MTSRAVDSPKFISSKNPTNPPTPDLRPLNLQIGRERLVANSLRLACMINPTQPSHAQVIDIVMCNESGHTKFPFSYLDHVMLLTLAQARLSPVLGFAQAGSLLLILIAIFGRLWRSLPNRFNSSRGGPELVPYIKIAKNVSHLGPIVLYVRITIGIQGFHVARIVSLYPFVGLVYTRWSGTARCHCTDRLRPLQELWHFLSAA